MAVPVPSADLLDGFERTTVDTGEATIAVRRRGAGPAVLLLHGYPQTQAMWHAVAPRLAEEYTVVLTDLRGYGDSSKPAGDARHRTYSKRATARDQVQVMTRLGFERFSVVGHDRGGRVGHRLALDNPDRVAKLAVIDIAPTHMMLHTADMRFALAYYHWFFLSQPYDLPERLIGADPDYWVRRKLGAHDGGERRFHPAALAEYLRCFRDPAAIHAGCEDYRAAASVDLDDDEHDMDTKLRCPVLALWGHEGFVGRRYDVVAAWWDRAADVTGHGLPCGHHVPEEDPDGTYAALRSFLRA